MRKMPDVSFILMAPASILPNFVGRIYQVFLLFHRFVQVLAIMQQSQSDKRPPANSH